MNDDSRAAKKALQRHLADLQGEFTLGALSDALIDAGIDFALAENGPAEVADSLHALGDEMSAHYRPGHGSTLGDTRRPAEELIEETIAALRVKKIPPKEIVRALFGAAFARAATWLPAHQAQAALCSAVDAANRKLSAASATKH